MSDSDEFSKSRAELLKCRGCMEYIKTNSILKHLTKKDSCNEHYSDEQIRKIKEMSKKRAKVLEKRWKIDNSDTVKKQNAAHYSKNKAKIQMKREVDAEKSSTDYFKKKHHNDLKELIKSEAKTAKDFSQSDYNFYKKKIEAKIERLKEFGVVDDKFDVMLSEFQIATEKFHDKVNVKVTELNDLEENDENWKTVRNVFNELTSHESNNSYRTHVQNLHKRLEKELNEIAVENSVDTTCDGCGKVLAFNRILMHLGQAKACKAKYDDNKLKILKEKSKERANLAKRAWDEENKEQVAEIKSNYYQKNKEKISKEKAVYYQGKKTELWKNRQDKKVEEAHRKRDEQKAEYEKAKIRNENSARMLAKKERDNILEYYGPKIEMYLEKEISEECKNDLRRLKQCIDDLYIENEQQIAKAVEAASKITYSWHGMTMAGKVDREYRAHGLKHGSWNDFKTGFTVADWRDLRDEISESLKEAEQEVGENPN